MTVPSPTLNRNELASFLRAQKWAVQASVSAENKPQAAVIGVAVSDALELVFDTFSDSRKAIHFRSNPHAAFVLGWDEGQTVQYEAVMDEPSGEALIRLKALYFKRFPDGRDREEAGNIAYFRATPTWIRYSDFRGATPRIETWSGDALRALLEGDNS